MELCDKNLKLSRTQLSAQRCPEFGETLLGGQGALNLGDDPPKFELQQPASGCLSSKAFGEMTNLRGTLQQGSHVETEGHCVGATMVAQGKAFSIWTAATRYHASLDQVGEVSLEASQADVVQPLLKSPIGREHERVALALEEADHRRKCRQMAGL